MEMEIEVETETERWIIGKIWDEEKKNPDLNVDKTCENTNNLINIHKVRRDIVDVDVDV